MTQATELRELASIISVDSSDAIISRRTSVSIDDATEYSNVEASELNPVSTDALYLNNIENTSTNGKISILMRSTGGGGGTSARITLKNDRSGNGSLRFLFRNSDHTTEAKEKFAFTSDGKLGVGLLGLSNINNPQAPIHVGTDSIVSTDSTVIIEAPIYPSLEFDSQNTNASNRRWKFSSVYNSYGTFEILRGATSGAAPNVTTMSLTKDGRVAIGPSHIANHVLDVQGDIHTTTAFRADESRHDVSPIISLDFSRGQLDDRVQYSRSGIASYIGSNGLVEYVDANKPRFDHDPISGECLGLLVEPNRTNIAETTINQGTSVDFNNMYQIRYEDVAPDGSYNATRVLASPGVSRHEVTIRYNGTSGNIYVSSCYVKPLGTVTHLMFSRAGGSDKVNFDLANGVALAPGGNAIGTIVAMKNGWYRCSIQYTETSTGLRSTYMSPGAVTGSSSVYNNLDGDGINGILLWGVQVEEVATGKEHVTSYIPRQLELANRSSKASYHDENGIVNTVGNDNERWGYRYDPVTRKNLPTGMMIEPAKTQMAPDTEQFGAAWYVNNCTKSSAATILPDGTEGVSFKLIMNNGADPNSATAAGMYIGITAAVASPIPVANSIYVKADGENIFRIRDGLRTGAFIDFNLSTGAISANTSVFQQSHMEKMANGWYRCSWTYEFQGTSGYTGSWLAMRGGSTGNGTDGLLLWGAQMELYGTTSYMHNSGAAGAVTRALDVHLSHTGNRGDDFVVLYTKDIEDFDPKEITIFHDIENFVYATNSRLWSLEDGTLDNRVAPQTHTTTAFRFVNLHDGETRVNQNKSITNWQDRHRYAVAMTNTTSQIYWDGADFLSLTGSYVSSTNVDRIRIGGLNNGFTSCGRHRKLSVYNKSLANSQLAALTGDPS